MNKNEMTIADIHESLKIMGFGINLNVLAQMTPLELKRFHKKAYKAYKLVTSLERQMAELESRASDSLNES